MSDAAFYEEMADESGPPRAQIKRKRRQHMIRGGGPGEVISGPSVPANALLAENGTPLRAEDGSYILVE